MNMEHVDSAAAQPADLQRLQAILRRLPPPSRPTREEMLAEAAELEPDHEDQPTTSDETQSRIAPRRRSVRLRSYFVSACAAAAACAALVLIGPRIPELITAFGPSHFYHTGPGGFAKIVLRDHSEVTLSGSTELRVRFSQTQRHAELVRGEAFFKITHDPQIPFVVDAGRGRITDLGTTFDVRYYSKEVVVSVTEGAVMVTPMAEQAQDNSAGRPQSATVGSQVEVKQGQGVSYDAKGELGEAYAIDLNVVTSWLYGRRVYKATPLSKVIEDMQLYSTQRIELDPALDSVLFSGYIDQSKAEQWVWGLEDVYPVKIDNTQHNRLFIRCDPPGCLEAPR